MTPLPRTENAVGRLPRSGSGARDFCSKLAWQGCYFCCFGRGEHVFLFRFKKGVNEKKKLADKRYIFISTKIYFQLSASKFKEGKCWAYVGLKGGRGGELLGLVSLGRNREEREGGG